MRAFPLGTGKHTGGCCDVAELLLLSCGAGATQVVVLLSHNLVDKPRGLGYSRNIRLGWVMARV